jgi:hypothetical protein
MNIKGLIGYNVFETANNICAAIRLFEEGIREMEDIINGVHLMHFQGVKNAMFAHKLFTYLLEHEDMQEGFIELFMEHYLEYEDAMAAFDATVNQIKIGEA